MAPPDGAGAWHPDPGNLGPALLVAVLFHGALIFGLGFNSQPRDVGVSSLEVTLARHPARERPRDAELLAAVDQLGSGDQQVATPVTSDQMPLVDAAQLRPVDPLPAPRPTLPAADPTERPVIATHDGERSDALDADNEAARQQAVEQPWEVREVASLRARLDMQKQAYSRIPRTLVLTAASARAAEEADYLYRWIEWVERIGNENYPEEARRRQLFGKLRLAVAISRDGSVEQVEILHSSGQRVLDQAAVRIVRLAAPFSPIPPTIHADRVEVIRTWHFIPGEGLTTSAE